jgi:Hypothetical glycosyl hydrolase family 15
MRNMLGYIFACANLRMFFLLFVLAWAQSWCVASDFGYPRVAGMNIGAKNYESREYQERLAKLDWVVLGFYPDWRGRRRESVRDVVASLRSRNPSLLVGQYTNIIETYSDRGNIPNRDIFDKVEAEGWWLDRVGAKVQWNSGYKTWLVNISDGASTDMRGRRFSEWMAERNSIRLALASNTFDIWYTDNVERSPKTMLANWGVPVSRLDSAYRDGFQRYWGAIRDIRPDVLIVANIVGHVMQYPEYRGKVNGVFLEAIAGADWSTYSKSGWLGMMKTYYGVFPNLLSPKLVGFNVWGGVNDYSFMRFMLASCLLGDGYFSYSDKSSLYNEVPWFDEFDFQLGAPLQPPVVIQDVEQVYMRRFEKGLVVVNPSATIRQVDVGLGYSYFQGRQDVAVNSGLPVRYLRVPGRTGFILRKGHLQ